MSSGKSVRRGILLLFLILSRSVVAQQASFLDFGLGLSTFDMYRGTSASPALSYHLETGWEGALTSSPLGYQMSFRLLSKGAQHFRTPMNDHVTKLRTLYLEVPFDILYTFPFGEHWQLKLGAGPFLAAGIQGKVKSDGGEYFQAEVRSYGGSAGLRRLDAGVNGIARLQYKKYFIGLYYDKGLIPIHGKRNGVSFPCNTQLQLAFGYYWY